MRKRHAFFGVALCAGIPLLGCIAWGCSSPPTGDARFSATTNDEGQELVVLADPISPSAVSPPPAGSTGSGGPPIDGGGPTGLPSGTWSFDDCSPSSPFLRDGTGNGATAQHPINSTCVPGISGQAVAIHGKKDMVQIADEPQFTVSDRVAVAAWVQPTSVDGDQPIVLKRLNTSTSFSLGIHGGNAEFSIVLANGKTVKSLAPIDPNVWTHVGGFYDGRFLFLFVNGEQVGQVAARGLIRNVNAPIRIGATSQTQFMNGLIDEVWISTNPVTGSDIAALSCIHRPSTIAVNPTTSGPVPVGTTVNYSVVVTNNDTGSCQPQEYFAQVPSQIFDGGVDSGTGDDGGVVVDAGKGGDLADSGVSPPPPPPPPVGSGQVANGAPPPSDSGITDAGISDVTTQPDVFVPPSTSLDGLQIFANPTFTQSVLPGATFAFNISVTGTEEADPGLHEIPFTVFSFFGQQITSSVFYDLLEDSGCRVSTPHELTIRDTSIVDDPIRTSFGSPVGTPHRGAWTFGRLMRDMAKTEADAPALAEQLFRSWLQNQTVNGFTLQARPSVQQVVFNNWPRTQDGQLDLDRSPLRLLAIVNRLDLRDLSRGDAGEGRFVFGVLGPGNNPEQFTVILEFSLQAHSTDDVLGWANAWHALSSHPFPSEEYNLALEAITARFSGRNAAPDRPNGSGLDQLRTNEISLAPRWEFRQFGLSASTGLLEPRGIDLTPDLSFNNTSTLARFVNANAASIIADQFTVPAQFEGAPFLAGSVFNDLIEWNAPGINSGEARFHLSLNTCNGCHGPETNTTFLQISPRFPGQTAQLSGFLTGTTVFDPQTGVSRTLNDLARRNTDLKALVCPATPPVKGARVKAAASASGAAASTIAKGISRVH